VLQEEDATESLEEAMEKLIDDTLAANPQCETIDVPSDGEHHASSKVPTVVESNEPSKGIANNEKNENTIASSIDKVRENVLNQLMSHDRFDEFCAWCNVSKQHWKENTLDLDLELSKWLGFLRTHSVQNISGPTQQYIDLICNELAENPLCHPKFPSFKLGSHAAMQPHEHPFTSMKHVLSDYDHFKTWLAEDIAYEKIVRVQVARAMSHSMWPNYVQQCLSEGAEDEFYENVDAVMSGDGAETMADWNTFLGKVEWIQQDWV
jgi:hypothetical protein